MYELPEPVQVLGSSWMCPPPTQATPSIPLHMCMCMWMCVSVAAALYFGCCRRRRRCSRFWCAFSQSLWHWANARNACHMQHVADCRLYAVCCSQLATCSIQLATYSRLPVRPIKPGKSAYFTCQDFRKEEQVQDVRRSPLDRFMEFATAPSQPSASARNKSHWLG